MKSYSMPTLLVLLALVCHIILATPVERVSLRYGELLREARREQIAEIQQFTEFVNKYSKSYANDTEVLKRFDIFCHALKKINEYNARYKGRTEYGVNAFTDLSWDEFRSKYLLSERPFAHNSNKGHETFTKQPLGPVHEPPLGFGIDWREKGVVTHIKDQGQCGSCWAFATVAVLESINAIATGKLQNFSDQALIDCTPGTYGCGGALFTNSFPFAVDKGAPLEEDYPYTASQGLCREYKPVAKFAYAQPLSNDLKFLTAELESNGPFAASFKVGMMFQHYMSGVYITDGECNIDIGWLTGWHATAVVGYGTTEQGVPYWILKNSWGTSWGEKGFGRYLAGVNQCHIEEGNWAGLVD